MRCVIAGFFFGLLCATTTPKLSDDARLFHRQHVFAEAHNLWAIKLQALSPYSPDYWEQVREDWARRELGEKFRRLEARVMGGKK